MKQNNIDYEAEYYKIKKNNRCLAKALAEQQQLTKRFQDENSLLQKKLYNSSTLNMQYDKIINELLNSAKKNLDKCVDLANHFSDNLLMCHQASNLKKTLDGDDVNDLYKVNLRSNSPGSQKTQAVKPMVSGHVIHHPTINLSRLTEPRITDSPTVENSVQNHNLAPSPTLNNHEPVVLLTNSHNRLAIRGYLGESDISDESDESFEDDLINSGTNLTPPRSARSLGTLMEDDEDSRSPNNSITKEVRIMLEPLHLDNITHRTKSVKFLEDLPNKPPVQKRPLDDPLEGTSTMLDNSGNLADSNKFVTKRRSLTKKKDITGQKYKIKRNKTNDDKENNSTNDGNDSLDRLSLGENFNISIENGDNLYERRSRRLTPKSLAEPSLKIKLRR